MKKLPPMFNISQKIQRYLDIFFEKDAVPHYHVHKCITNISEYEYLWINLIFTRL
jgi:hypothetical protein